MYQAKAGGDQNKTKFGIKLLIICFLQCATRREVLRGNFYCIISMLQLIQAE